MKKIADKAVRNAVRGMSTLALALAVMFGMLTTAKADEEDAKRLLKSMSDYMAAQERYRRLFEKRLLISHLPNRASSG